MKLAIFTLVEHIYKDGKYYGYAPYVTEMNMWSKYADELIIVGLKSKTKDLSPIDMAYTHTKISFVEIPLFNIKTFGNVLKTLRIYPSVIIKMLNVMRKADHLHFRCPSNVAAMAAPLQIMFPSKPKTVKYAGNWKPESKQPLGYRFQKYIFSHPFLSRNTKVLVYGKWPNQTKNVVPFMTATYSNADRIPHKAKDYTGVLKFVFIGSLVEGKRPLYTIKIVEALLQKGYKCQLDIYGDGVLKQTLQDYVSSNQLEDHIFIHGNQSKDVIKQAVKQAHFTILPSKSEGWPKAIAEGMFFGAIPIATNVSCLAWILDNGNRGILIDTNLESTVNLIVKHLNKVDLQTMSKNALEWSQQYTLERFDSKIKAILEK